MIFNTEEEKPMQAAKQFMKQLQEGNTTEAIKTIKESIHQRSVGLIEEQRVAVLESYGFSEKKMQEEEDKEEKDMDDEDEEDEEKEESEDE
jgi:hypothetical protein